MIVNHKVIHSSISSFHLSLTIGFVFEHDSGLTDSLSDYTPSPSVMMIPVLKARGRERVVRTEEALSDRGRVNYVSGDVFSGGSDRVTGGLSPNQTQTKYNHTTT